MNYKMIMKAIDVYFIIPEDCHDENDCPEIMQQAFAAVQSLSEEGAKGSWLRADQVPVNETESSNSYPRSVYVLSKFDGPVFQKLTQPDSPYIVVGGSALLESVRGCEELGARVGWPVYSRALRGVRLASSGLGRAAAARVARLAGYLGAHSSPHLLADTTHLLATNVLSRKCQAALRAGHMQVVEADWVEAAWRAAQAQQPTPAPRALRALAGVVATCSGLARRDKAELRALLADAGATYDAAFNSERCTLVIVDQYKGSEKEVAARQYGIPVVLTAWVREAVRTGRALLPAPAGPAPASAAPAAASAAPAGPAPALACSSPVHALSTLPNMSIDVSRISVVRGGGGGGGGGGVLLDESCAEGQLAAALARLERQRSPLQRSPGQRSPALDGLRVHLLGAQPLLDKVKRWVARGGGVCVPEPECATHVCAVPPAVRHQLPDKDTPLLSALWLLESVEQGRLLDTEPYLLGADQSTLSCKETERSSGEGLFAGMVCAGVALAEPELEEAAATVRRGGGSWLHGEAAREQAARLTHLVLPVVADEEAARQAERLCAGTSAGSAARPRWVSPLYVSDCAAQGERVPLQPCHEPALVPRAARDLLRGDNCSVSGYEGAWRLWTEAVVSGLGGRVAARMARRGCTLLVCAAGARSDKLRAATRWGLPAVSHRYLLACLAACSAPAPARPSLQPYLLALDESGSQHDATLRPPSPPRAPSKQESPSAPEQKPPGAPPEQEPPSAPPEQEPPSAPAAEPSCSPEDSSRPGDSERLPSTSMVPQQDSEELALIQMYSQLQEQLSQPPAPSPEDASMHSRTAPSKEAAENVLGRDEAGSPVRGAVSPPRPNASELSQHSVARQRELSPATAPSREGTSSPAPRAPPPPPCLPPHLADDAHMSPASRYIGMYRAGLLEGGAASGAGDGAACEAAGSTPPALAAALDALGAAAAGSARQRWARRLAALPARASPLTPSPSRSPGPGPAHARASPLATNLTPVSAVCKRFLSEGARDCKRARTLHLASPAATPPPPPPPLDHGPVAAQLRRLSAVLCGGGGAGGRSLLGGAARGSPARPPSPPAHPPRPTSPQRSPSPPPSQPHTVDWDDQPAPAPAPLPAVVSRDPTPPPQDPEPLIKRFMISSNIEDREGVCAALVQAGAQVSAEWEPAWEALVCGAVGGAGARSEKLLASWAGGKWLLAPTYARACAAAGRLLPPDPHEHAAARPWRLHCQQGGAGPFSGVVAVVCGGEARGAVVARVLAAGGGRAAAVLSAEAARQSAVLPGVTLVLVEARAVGAGAAGAWGARWAAAGVPVAPASAITAYLERRPEQPPPAPAQLCLPQYRHLLPT